MRLLLNRLRLRFGLHWPGSHPPIGQWTKIVLAVATIVALPFVVHYVVVLRVSHVAISAQSDTLIQDRDMLLACLNGHAMLTMDETVRCQTKVVATENRVGHD